MSGQAKFLIGIGLFIAVLGLVMLLAERQHLPFGRLPGDFTYRSKSGNVTFFFPLATSILLSAVFSIIIWFLNR
jgi:hypothetical protein